MDPSISFIDSHPQVIGLSFANSFDLFPTRIDFLPGTSQEDIEAAYRDAQAFDWTPPPNPDPVGFRQAFNTDSKIIDKDKLALFPYMGIFDDYRKNPTSSKATWALVKKVLGFADASILAIEAYSAEFGMPL